MKKFIITKKKVLALLLVLIFTLTALTGCGKSGVNVDTGKVTLPALPKEYVTSENITTAALQQYIYARLKLEQLTQAKTPEEFEKLVAETIEDFKYADEFAGKAVKYADYAALANENSPQAKGTIIEVKTATKGGNPFMSTVYAAGDEKFDAKAWAEDITKKFDAGEAGKQVRNLAEQLGVDAKEAYSQLKLAQDIIKKGADADAAFFDNAMKAAMVTKTACKVGLLVTGTIVTAGGVGAVSTLGLAADAAILTVNAADCIVDIGVTTSTIVLGEDHYVTAALNKTADDIAPFVAVAGVGSIVRCDFSKADKLMATTISTLDYIGQSAMDYKYNDKIIGIDVSNKSDGKTDVKATAIEIPKTNDDKVDGDKLNKELEKANLPTIPSEAPELKPIDEAIKDFEKNKPDPAEVLKQIDEALKQIEALLKELGKIEDMPDIVGTYIGTFDSKHYDDATGSIHTTSSGNLSITFQVVNKLDGIYNVTFNPSGGFFTAETVRGKVVLNESSGVAVYTASNDLGWSNTYTITVNGSKLTGEIKSKNSNVKASAVYNFTALLK